MRGNLPEPHEETSSFAGVVDRVSAILPTFNSRLFVSRAIDSVLGQRGNYLHELIVVDDCSTDGTADFIDARYGGDPRVVVLRAPVNGGPGQARNMAIAAARGDWIAPIDADDAWLADRLARLVPKCGPGVDLLFDNLLGYDHALATVSGPLFPNLPEHLSVGGMVSGRSPTTGFDYGFLKPLMRRTFIQGRAIVYPKVRISEDMLFYLECLAQGARTRLTSEACYVYTTPVGRLSKKRSPISHSVPDDVMVAGLISDLADRYETQLGETDIAALRQHAGDLMKTVSISRLYDNWTRRNYGAFAAQLLVDPKAWRLVAAKLVQRVMRRSGLLTEK